MAFVGLHRRAMEFRNAGILVYSIVVAASTIPSLHQIPSALSVPYFILVPGYCLSLVVNRQEPLAGRLFYTIGWGIALISGVAAVESLNPLQQSLPLSIVIPLITVILLVSDYLHER